MKRNDWSVQKTEHYYMLSRAQDKRLRMMSGSLMNHSFELVLFSQPDKPVYQIRVNHLKQQLKQRRSTSYSVKTLSK